jgi:hypothetical protein
MKANKICHGGHRGHREGKPFRSGFKNGGVENRYLSLDKVPPEYKDKTARLVQLSGGFSAP